MPRPARERSRSLRRALCVGAGVAALAAIPVLATEEAPPAGAPVVPLSSEARDALSPLGEGVVGDALPAQPIRDPARLYHLRAGHWEYDIVEGANKGRLEGVEVERVEPGDPDSAWQLVTSTGDVQQLKVTRHYEVVKLAQEDADSDRLVVYEPGLALDPDMQAGQDKTANVKIRSYKREKRDKVEYDGTLAYTVTYLGAYRITTPAGTFDTRLLKHDYRIEIGPAKSKNVNYTFYADGVGKVAEVARDQVSALFVYRRKTLTARVLASLPSLGK